MRRLRLISSLPSLLILRRFGPIPKARCVEWSSPLYKNVPTAARRDPKLYELLALVDAIRDGRARDERLQSVS